jgi:hypothetical protein
MGILLAQFDEGASWPNAPIDCSIARPRLCPAGREGKASR